MLVLTVDSQLFTSHLIYLLSESQETSTFLGPRRVPKLWGFCKCLNKAPNLFVPIAIHG